MACWRTFRMQPRVLHPELLSRVHSPTRIGQRCIPSVAMLARHLSFPRLSRCGQAVSSTVNRFRYSTTISAADLKFGQPLHETHPHLLKAGERMDLPCGYNISSPQANCEPVTPGITALEYHQRRAKLASNLPNGSIAILPSADLKYRSGAVFYDFHQDPDFYYLTGAAPDPAPWE